MIFFHRQINKRASQAWGVATFQNICSWLFVINIVKLCDGSTDQLPIEVEQVLTWLQQAAQGKQVEETQNSLVKEILEQP